MQFRSSGVVQCTSLADAEKRLPSGAGAGMEQVLRWQACTTSGSVNTIDENKISIHTRTNTQGMTHDQPPFLNTATTIYIYIYIYTLRLYVYTETIIYTM